MRDKKPRVMCEDTMGEALARLCSDQDPSSHSDPSPRKTRSWKRTAVLKSEQSLGGVIMAQAWDGLGVERYMIDSQSSKKAS